jgi:hypothetical protein
MIYLHTKFHVRLQMFILTAVKPKAECRFRAAAMLVLTMLENQNVQRWHDVQTTSYENL